MKGIKNIKQLRSLELSSKSSSGPFTPTGVMPIDVTTNSFYSLISDLYTKYNHVIRENIKKIHSTSIDKMVLRQRSIVLTFPIDSLPVANNVYVNLPPVFHIFGLLLPYISRIVQVDMYGMFEQLANLSEVKPLSETETKLIKMSIMNDVKILDLNDMPLTYEQQINVLVFLNIFYHVVTNSLFQIGKEHIPKMIEQNLLNHFNSIIDTKFKMSCVYDKLNDNDPYHVRVLRKTLLAFGIRPVKLTLKHVPASYKGMFPGRMNSAQLPTELSSDCVSNDDLDEFVDSITISHDKINAEEYQEEEEQLYQTPSNSAYAKDMCLSIGKYLEHHAKLVTNDNKLYWSKFKRAYGILPVFIGRRDVYKKKEYEQLLVANVECCETRFNTRKVLSRNLFCPNILNDNSRTKTSNNILGVDYFPLAVMGTFIESSELTGSIDDVEFLYINPFSMHLEGMVASPGSTPMADRYCADLRKILQKFDEHFFCPYKKPSAYNCSSDGNTLNSLSSVLTDKDGSVCCDISVFTEFKELLTQQNVGLLFLSNKTCSSPILINCDNAQSASSSITLKDGNTYKVIGLNHIKCMIQSSTTAILYVTDISC